MLLYILLKYTPHAFYNRKVRGVRAVIIIPNAMLCLKCSNLIPFRGVAIYRVVVFLKDLRLIVAVEVLIFLKP